jgi:hypothetical protein
LRSIKLRSSSLLKRKCLKGYFQHLNLRQNGRPLYRYLLRPLFVGTLVNFLSGFLRKPVRYVFILVGCYSHLAAHAQNQCCGSASGSTWIRIILVTWIRIKVISWIRIRIRISLQLQSQNAWNMGLFQNFSRVWAFIWQLDPDPHQGENSDPDQHPDLHQIKIKSKTSSGSAST